MAKAKNIGAVAVTLAVGTLDFASGDSTAVAMTALELDQNRSSAVEVSLSERRALLSALLEFSVEQKVKAGSVCVESISEAAFDLASCMGSCSCDCTRTMGALPQKRWQKNVNPQTTNPPTLGKRKKTTIQSAPVITNDSAPKQ